VYSANAKSRLLNKQRGLMMKILGKAATGTSINDLAEKAMRKAVEKVIQTHCQLGLPLMLWRDAKVVQVHPDQLPMRESRVRYKPRKSSKT
jgi:hypothetical protein